MLRRLSLRPLTLVASFLAPLDISVRVGLTPLQEKHTVNLMDTRAVIQVCDIPPRS